MTSDNAARIVRLSAIDEERFGNRIARADAVSLPMLAAISDFCSQNRVEMLIARCETTQLDVAQMMEQDGFLLMDTLIYYQCDLAKNPIPEDRGIVPVRPFRANEIEEIGEVAAEAFAGYYGHYHADKRLDQGKCDETYISWVKRSCESREVADEVLVADMDGEVVGFATLHMISAEQGEGVLFGVAPKAQGKGIYRSFMINGLHWCAEQGANSMLVSTQITNIAVQKVWHRLGFEPIYSYYTFHKWFDR